MYLHVVFHTEYITEEYIPFGCRNEELSLKGMQ